MLDVMALFGDITRRNMVPGGLMGGCFGDGYWKWNEACVKSVIMCSFFVYQFARTDWSGAGVFSA